MAVLYNSTLTVGRVDQRIGPYSGVPRSLRQGLRGFTGKQKWQTKKVSLRWALMMFALGEMTCCLMCVLSS